jgi:hypothetical protein
MLDTAPRPITTRSRRRSRASVVSIFVAPEYAAFLDSHSVGTACSPFAGASGDTASDDIRYSDMGFIGSLYRLQTNGQFTASVVVDATRGRASGVGLCGGGPVCPGTRGSEGFRTHRRLPGDGPGVMLYTRTPVGYHDGRVFPVSTISPGRSASTRGTWFVSGCISHRSTVSNGVVGSSSHAPATITTIPILGTGRNAFDPAIATLPSLMPSAPSSSGRQAPSSPGGHVFA